MFHADRFEISKKWSSGNDSACWLLIHHPKIYLSALFFANAFGSLPYLPFFFVKDAAILRYEHSVLFVITLRV
jgi:hypothetical protein